MQENVNRSMETKERGSKEDKINIDKGEYKP